MRVVIVNQHTNNFGDDAAGIALVNEVLESLSPEQVDIFYIWDKETGGLPTSAEGVFHHRIPVLSGLQDERKRLAARSLLHTMGRRWSPPEFEQLIRVASAADIVLVSPAGANLGIYKDWTYLFVLLALVRSGIRPHFFQNTIGKSDSPVFNRVARRVLTRSSMSVRERASFEYLTSHGMTAYLGVDSALLLDPHGVTLPEISSKQITVIPTKLRWHRDHRHFDDDAFMYSVLAPALSIAARALCLPVVVLAHLYGAETEDEHLESLTRVLRANGVEANLTAPKSYVGYQAALSKSAVTVSMRYHGLILSSLEAVPCVAISYENKMVEAAKYLGVDEFLCSPANLTASTLAARIVDAHGAKHLPQELRRRTELLRPIARGPILSHVSERLRDPEPPLSKPRQG